MPSPQGVTLPLPDQAHVPSTSHVADLSPVCIWLQASSGAARRGSRPSAGNSAIARSGHTNRGRVKQKSHKSAEILQLGSVRYEVTAILAESHDLVAMCRQNEVDKQKIHSFGWSVVEPCTLLQGGDQ